MEWSEQLRTIIDGLQTSQDLEEFSVLWNLEDDEYIKQRLIDLKWNELTVEIGLGDLQQQRHTPPIMIGHGSDDNISFRIEQISQKQFSKSKAIDRHYKIRIDQQHLVGQKLNTMHHELHAMFDQALQEVKQNLHGNDLGRIVLNHPSLTNEIVVPLIRLEHLTADSILENIENVLTSNEDLPMDEDFDLSIGTIEIPKGSGKRKYITDLHSNNNSLMEKRSIGYVHNTDKMCLQRSIAYAWCKMNVVNQRQWIELTELSPNASVIKNVLRYGKVPKSFYDNLRNNSRKEQMLLAMAISAKAGVSTDRMGSLCDIGKFEQCLNVKIAVISSKLGNKFIRVPSRITPSPTIYLYLVENDTELHFYPILSVTGFYSSSYFCETCMKPYSTRGKHRCQTTCLICKHDRCIVSDTQISCRKCHMTCRSKACYDRHITAKEFMRGGKKLRMLPECDKYWKCTRCKKVIRLKHGYEKNAHRCGDYVCQLCNQVVQMGHLCYQRAIHPHDSQRKFIFFDIETTQNTIITDTQAGAQLQGKERHCANLIIAQKTCSYCIDNDLTNTSTCEKCGAFCLECCEQNRKKPRPGCKTCNTRQNIFYGDNACDNFCQWLFTPAHSDTTVISHNGRGFDHYPILKYLIQQSIIPQTIFTGSKLMYMHIARSLNITFIDSLNHMPMKLADMPECFDLGDNFKKGYWPYLFNTKQNENYVGPYPDKEFYGYNNMPELERQTFLDWHKTQLEENVLFNFKNELIGYCKSDVDILRLSCMQYWQLMKACTGEYEQIPNPKTGALETKLVRYVDPFENVTIASTCAKIYRTKFLEEKWQVEMVHIMTQCTGVYEALVKNEKMLVQVEDQWIKEADLYKHNYTIQNKRFMSSPFAQIPSNGYHQDRYSKKSIQWLEWLMFKAEDGGNPIQIQHALNQGEKQLPNSKYKLDGYCSTTNTAYEFHGCYFHGCPVCLRHNRDLVQHPSTKQTVDELYNITMKKERYIKRLGMNLVRVWEHEFDHQFDHDVAMQDFLKTLDIQERLNARDALFGGRTETIQMYRKVQDDEQIKYVDFTSLYPFTNKTCKYPIGHPTIITNNFKDIQCYFGFAKVKFLPPKQLYLPVLPYRSNGKLKFTLCRSCADKENQLQCKCPDEDRAIVGTYCTPELEKAVEKGYSILKLYEVYHFEQTEQYDPVSKTGGIFTQYINTFLKIKQESSGFPSWVHNPQEQQSYINNYALNEGVLLEVENIQKNPGKRALSKLALNSLWGKFGQRQNMRQTSYFHESEEDKFFTLIADSSKEVINFHIVDKDVIVVEWSYLSSYVPDDTKSNVFIACFTTCWARLKLYSVLEMLGARVLYMDTDSAIYITKPGQPEPSLGDYLGELTNELATHEHIKEFVSAGPKNYAYLTNKNKRECKVRGFTLKNYTNSKLINFDVLKKMVTCDKSLTVNVVNNRKICRHKRTQTLYNRKESKCYKLVFNKRVIKDNNVTLPYGY